MKSANITENSQTEINHLSLNQPKNENFLNKKRNIIIISQSSSDSESSGSESNSSSEKNKAETQTELKITENNLGNNYFRTKNKTNINSDDTEIITGMYKTNINRLDLNSLKPEKNSKKKNKEKNNRARELRIKNNYDLENIFEKNFENLKKMNQSNSKNARETNSNKDNSFVDADLNNLNINFTNNQINNINNENNENNNKNNNLINVNKINSKNFNSVNSKLTRQKANEIIAADENEKLSKDNFNKKPMIGKVDSMIKNNEDLSKCVSLEKRKISDNNSKSKYSNEKSSAISDKNRNSFENIESNFNSISHRRKNSNFTEIYNKTYNTNNTYNSNTDNNISNYLEFENFYEQIFNNYFGDDLNKINLAKEKLMKLAQQAYQSEENLKENEEGKSSENRPMNNSKKNESKREDRNFNVEDYISFFFDNKKKLNKVEMKRKYINLKNVIKFSTRTDKAIDIKKLTRLNLEREKLDMYNNNCFPAGVPTKSYKEEKNFRGDNNHKNGLFSVNSSFLNHNSSNSNMKFDEDKKNVSNVTSYYNKIYKRNTEDNSDFSDSELQKDFSSNLDRFKTKIIKQEETKEKNLKEEKSYINTRLNELKDRNNNRLKFGENPLKVVNDIYEQAKVSYKTKMNNKSLDTSEKTNKLIYNSVLDVLELGEKIKLIPRLIFDFKNFDKNTFSVRDRSNNNFNSFFQNNNVINSFQGKCYSKNFDFPPNNNINLNLNYKKNFQGLPNNNPIPQNHKYSYDSEDFSSSKNNNNSSANLNSITIPHNILATNNNSNLLDRAYVCDICNEVFSNGQGLGGHMSRKHPNQSVKYKFKKETREKRNLKREIIYEAKRKILKKYHENYDELMNSVEGRKLIKRICKENKDEYYRIKKEIKMHMK